MARMLGCIDVQTLAQKQRLPPKAISIRLPALTEDGGWLSLTTPIRQNRSPALLATIRSVLPTAKSYS
jgi:hypothetical protein